MGDEKGTGGCYEDYELWGGAGFNGLRVEDTHQQYWTMAISTASTILYQVYIIYWFADGFGIYARFFNVTCGSATLSLFVAGRNER
jgi:hypothetical protein